MPIQPNFLIDLIAAFISGGGAGHIVFAVMDEWAILTGLSPRRRRSVALAFAALLAMALYLLLLWLTIATEISAWPQTPQSWVNNLLAVAFIAVTSSQARHGAQLSDVPRLGRDDLPF